MVSRDSLVVGDGRYLVGAPGRRIPDVEEEASRPRTVRGRRVVVGHGPDVDRIGRTRRLGYGIEPSAHRGAGLVEAPEGIGHEILRVGVLQSWIVAQPAVDIGEMTGTEQGSGDSPVLVLERLDPAKAELVDRFGVQIEGGMALDHGGIHGVTAGEMAQPGLLGATSGRQGDVAQCPGKASQAGTHMVPDRVDQIVTPAARSKPVQFGGGSLGGDRVLLRLLGEHPVQLSEALAHMPGERHQPGSRTIFEPTDELVDHGRKAPERLQVPVPVVGGDQWL